jgi:CubicO group peptidase (beta-lactamase class C family)
VGHGLGWEVGRRPRSVFGELSGPRVFGHPGGRSTVGWCDPDSGVACAILCNGTPAFDDAERRLCMLSDAVIRAIDAV